MLPTISYRLPSPLPEQTQIAPEKPSSEKLLELKVPGSFPGAPLTIKKEPTRSTTSTKPAKPSKPLRGVEKFDWQLKQFDPELFQKLKRFGESVVPVNEGIGLGLGLVIESTSSKEDRGATTASAPAASGLKKLRTFSNHHLLGPKISSLSSIGADEIQKTAEGARGNRSLSEAMKQAALIFNSLLESPETNCEIDSIPDERQRNAVKDLKAMMKAALQGDMENAFARTIGDENTIQRLPLATWIGNMRLIAMVIGMPTEVIPPDWDEIMPELGITRRQERENILRDNKPIRRALELYFTDVDRYFKGELPRAPKLILIGPPGTGKSRLRTRIQACLGLPRIFVQHDELLFEFSRPGGNSFGLFRREPENIGCGVICKEWMHSPQRAVTLAIDDIRWSNAPFIPGKPPILGVEGSDTAQEFLDAATHEMPLTFMAENEDKAPGMPVKDMLMFITSNFPVPAELKKIKGAPGETHTIQMPSRTTEEKISWTQSEATQYIHLDPSIWQRAGKYLPFIAETDSYCLGRDGMRDVQKAYQRILSLCRIDPDLSDEAAEREILKVLFSTADAVPEVADVKKQIQDKRREIEKEKKQKCIAMLSSLAEDPELVKQVTTATEYLSFFVEMDTERFHRSAADIEQTFEKYFKVFETAGTDGEIKARILEMLAEDYPLSAQAGEAAHVGISPVTVPAIPKDVQTLAEFPDRIEEIVQRLRAEWADIKATPQSRLANFIQGTGGRELVSLGVMCGMVWMFPSRSIGSISVAGIATKLAQRWAEMIMEFFTGSSEPQSQETRGAQYIWDHLLNSPAANSYIEFLKSQDEGLAEAISDFKYKFEKTLQGKTSKGEEGFNPKKLSTAERRILSFFKYPIRIQLINWEQHIADKANPGAIITREEAKNRLMEENPELRNALAAFFQDLDLISLGLSRLQARLVLVGGSAAAAQHLFDDIIHITGMGCLPLTKKDWENGFKKILGRSHPFGLAQLHNANDISEKDMYGTFHADLPSQTYANFLVRIEGFQWENIADEDAALDFFDPAPENKEMLMRSFRIKHAGPIFDFAKLALMVHSPEPIPDKYKAMRSRVLQLRNPPLTTEAKIRSVQIDMDRASNSQEMEKIMERARRFLPFVIDIDSHCLKSEDVLETKNSFNFVISALRIDENISDTTMKMEIVKKMYAEVTEQDPPSLEEVEREIAAAKNSVKKQKKERALSTLTTRNVDAPLRKKVEKYLDFMTSMDTDRLYRSGNEAFDRALGHLIELHISQPQIGRAQVEAELGRVLKQDAPEWLLNMS